MSEFLISGPAGHRRVRLRTLPAWRCVDRHGPAGRFDRAKLAATDSELADEGSAGRVRE